MKTSTEEPRREDPWMVGLRAAKANILPGLVIHGVMLGLLLADYFYPPTTRYSAPPIWCMMGMLVDALYRGQAMVFGSEVHCPPWPPNPP